MSTIPVQKRRKRSEEHVDEAIEESFPASDPPSYSRTARAGLLQSILPSALSSIGACVASAGSWASGVLFDNVRLEGGALRLDNLEIWNQGVGWALANSLAWQTSASVIISFS